uniref:Ig-like domain-containing protein n=1 Tax=Scleropages formosus TaxID=113540 RepID=A0A8C9R4R0_SCLFO
MCFSSAPYRHCSGCRLQHFALHGTISTAVRIQLCFVLFSLSCIPAFSCTTHPEWSRNLIIAMSLFSLQVMYFNGNVYWGKSWGNQAELVQNPPTKGTASLRILNVQPSNAGIYICEVTNPVDWESSGQGLINFTVLVPPSTPQCKLNGNPYAGNDVTLTCKASYGIPAPIYSWSREKNAPPLSPDNLGGSLILRNLSSSFSGSYTCMASNELGSSMCAVALRVTCGYPLRSAQSRASDQLGSLVTSHLLFQTLTTH